LNDEGDLHRKKRGLELSDEGDQKKAKEGWELNNEFRTKREKERKKESFYFFGHFLRPFFVSSKLINFEFYFLSHLSISFENYLPNSTHYF
jgi:hypothetical protein